jgi:hypothetical protein
MAFASASPSLKEERGKCGSTGSGAKVITCYALLPIKKISFERKRSPLEDKRPTYPKEC